MTGCGVVLPAALLSPSVAISKKYRADEKETKRLVSESIKKGLVKAFYSPDSSTIIFGEGIQTKLLELLQTKGKIYIDRTAKTLGIHSNLLRNQMKQFMENGQVEGWYTQDRGFATLDHLKSEILGILKLYEKISIKELVSRMFLPVKYVEILLQTLIGDGKLSGALSDGFFKRSEITPLITKKTKLPAWAIKKIEAAPFQSQEKVSLYSLGGKITSATSPPTLMVYLPVLDENETLLVETNSFEKFICAELFEGVIQPWETTSWWEYREVAVRSPDLTVYRQINASLVWNVEKSGLYTLVIVLREKYVEDIRVDLKISVGGTR